MTCNQSDSAVGTLNVNVINDSEADNSRREVYIPVGPHLMQLLLALH